MKQERTSYAFLMEMIWVCAFFLICASIFVVAFAKAEQLSRKADTLNLAVQATSNLVEDCLAAAEDGNLEDISELASEYRIDGIFFDLHSDLEDGLFTLTVNALDPEDGTMIYSLSTSRAILEAIW